MNRSLIALAIGIGVLLLLAHLQAVTTPPLNAASPSTWHRVADAEFQRLAVASHSATQSPSVTPRRTSKPAPKPVAIGRTLRGVATWYDYVPGGAAAGPGLRRFLGADWRGTLVVVSANGASVRVRLTDACWCPHGNRIIDLDDAAFSRLAPLGAGVIAVSVREVR